MEKEERIQEYVKKLESLRSLIVACESEAEECLNLAPSEACESSIREFIRGLKAKSQFLEKTIEHWRTQLEESEEG